jgi:hypothetical protein
MPNLTKDYSKMKTTIRKVLGKILALAIAACCVAGIAAETPPTLTVKFPAGQPEVMRGHLKMGGANPQGVEINATSRYLTRGGKPWLPVMGEFHFSRYPSSQWEDELLKMKSCGIQIVATYFFWIHHEEEEGTFVWTGDRDIRRFVELCQKHGLLVYLRMGPWSHGECRNGGFPDWLEKKSKAEGFPLRSEDPRYLALVRTYYSQMAEQVKGLLWKDGGPIIELAFRDGPADPLSASEEDCGPMLGIPHDRSASLSSRRKRISAGGSVPTASRVRMKRAGCRLQAVAAFGVLVCIGARALQLIWVNPVTLQLPRDFERFTCNLPPLWRPTRYL